MSLFEYILIALAFSIESMLLMRSQSNKTHIALTRGLAISLFLALTYAFMLFAGLHIGNLLRFEENDRADAYNTANTLVFIGISLLLCIKVLLPALRKKEQIAAYDINRWTTIVALAFASSIDLLIYGLGVGFLPQSHDEGLKAFIPMIICVFLLSYMGIMFGRQGTTLRPRRWHILSVLLLFSITLYHIIAL